MRRHLTHNVLNIKVMFNVFHRYLLYACTETENTKLLIKHLLVVEYFICSITRNLLVKGM